jgi:asparagine synthase (glutamine-hydrolysing)
VAPGQVDMGAFFLLRRVPAPDADARRRLLLAELDRQGFRRPQRFDAPGCEIHLFPPLVSGAAHAYRESADRFCLAAGTFIYRGETGTAALRRFLAEVEWPHVPWDDICGQFCVLAQTQRQLHLVTDRLGLYKVYRNADASILSSSFLAVAAAAPQRTVDPQGAYEYVFQGTTFGGRTIVREVELVDPDALLSIGATGVTTRPLAPIPHGWSDAGFAALREANLAALRRYVASVERVAAQGVSLALTGGYDSRLLLALLRERDLRPYVYVYGAADDGDVQVARRIAAGEGFSLAHTDRRAGPRLDHEALAAAVETNCRVFDGYPVDGIFDDGSDLQTRRERCRHGELALNGIGGELYRRPDLANLPYSTQDVVWRFFCGFHPLDCTAAFDEQAYCAAVGQAMTRAVGAAAGPLDRALVSLIVPAFYYRYWAGRNCSLNNRLGHALQPFCDLPVVRESVRIPVAARAYGAFEAALIRAVDPRLAAYPSSYGHAFTEPPPLANVVREWRATVRPPIHSRYGLVPQAQEHPYWLAPSAVAAIVDPEFPYLRRLFHLHRRVSPVRRNRICTLEYLYQRSSAVLP